MCIENNSWDEIKRRIEYNLTIKKSKNALFVLQQKLLKTLYFV
jgi:hypothetical protein